MRRYRPLPAVVFAIVVSALVGGLFGRSALATDDKVPEHYKSFTAALSAIEIELRRQGRVRPARLRRRSRHARHARSAFELLRPARVRADARAAGRALLRHRRLDSGDRRRHHGDASSSKDRRRTRRASAAATSSRRSPAKTPRAGRSSRRCASCAARRARPSRSRSSAAATTQLIPIELTRDEVTIPTVPAYFMIDATTGYIRMQDFGENTDRDVKHALRDLTSKGMRRLLFDIRGNPGGPLDQAIKVVERVPAAGKMIVYTRGRITNSDQDYRATGGQRVHRHPDRRAREPQQRERVGDRHRRAAGSRSRLHRRRDDVRQGARAVGLSHQRRRRPRADDGALLHAERPADSAAVGRELRRVSELLAARSGRQQAAQPERPEAHRRRPSGLQRRRHRARQARRRAARRLQPDAASAACCMRAARSRTTRRSSRPKATRASRSSRPAARRSTPNFVVDDAMVADFREQLKTDRIKIDEDGVQEGSRLHQGDDSLPDRRGGVRHRRGAAASDRRRSAGAGGARRCSAKPRS